MSKTSEDMRKILRVDRDAFSYQPYTGEEFQNFLSDPNTNVFLAIHGGRAVGEGIIRLKQDAHGAESPGKAYLDTIGVKEAYQHRGIGTQLLLHVLSNCINAGIASCILCVRDNNWPAVDLYGKFGFKETGERENKLYKALNREGVYMELDGLQGAEFKKKFRKIEQTFHEKLAQAEKPSKAKIEDSNRAFRERP